MEKKVDLSMDMFEKADKSGKNLDVIRRPSIKYWPDVWRRLKQNKLARDRKSVV